MVDENKTIENTSEKIIDKIKTENVITIKKSSYNKLLAALIAAIVISAFLGGYSIGTFGNSGVSSEELNEILSEIEVQQTAPVPIQQPSQPNQPQILQISLDDDPVKGNPDAPVTVVEFSDFQCPFCSRFYTQTLPQLQENYIDTGKIKLVYRDLPLDSLHPNARPAHIAAECADDQKKFWEYHDILFERQSEWNRLPPSALLATLNQYATELKLDSETFDLCIRSPQMANEVNQDYLEATNYGATGTPTFFVGNENDGFIKLVGAQPYSAFKNVIDNQLR